jgi:hypothetical protein
MPSSGEHFFGVPAVVGAAQQGQQRAAGVVGAGVWRVGSYGGGQGDGAAMPDVVALRGVKRDGRQVGDGNVGRQQVGLDLAALLERFEGDRGI